LSNVSASTTPAKRTTNDGFTPAAAAPSPQVPRQLHQSPMPVVQTPAAQVIPTVEATTRAAAAKPETMPPPAAVDSRVPTPIVTNTATTPGPPAAEGPPPMMNPTPGPPSYASNPVGPPTFVNPETSAAPPMFMNPVNQGPAFVNPTLSAQGPPTFMNPAADPRQPESSVPPPTLDVRGPPPTTFTNPMTPSVADASGPPTSFMNPTAPSHETSGAPPAPPNVRGPPPTTFMNTAAPREESGPPPPTFVNPAASNVEASGPPPPTFMNPAAPSAEASGAPPVFMNPTAPSVEASGAPPPKTSADARGPPPMFMNPAAPSVAAEASGPPTFMNPAAPTVEASGPPPPPPRTNAHASGPPPMFMNPAAPSAAAESSGPPPRTFMNPAAPSQNATSSGATPPTPFQTVADASGPPPTFMNPAAQSVGEASAPPSTFMNPAASGQSIESMSSAAPPQQMHPNDGPPIFMNPSAPQPPTAVSGRPPSHTPPTLQRSYSQDSSLMSESSGTPPRYISSSTEDGSTAAVSSTVQNEDPPKEVIDKDSLTFVTRNELNVAEDAKSDVTEQADNLSAKSAALPSGWAKLWDDVNGAYYYYNNSTGYSSWEPPPQEVEYEIEHTESSDTTMALPTGITKLWDEKSGRHVYVDQNTGETTWNDPSSSHVEEEDPVEVKHRWTSAKDETGAVYYFNETTGETSWEKPDDVDDIAEIAEPPQDSVVTEELPSKHVEQPEEKNDDALPPGWSVGEHEGQQYYFNEETGESSWERPSAVEEPANDTVEQSAPIKKEESHDISAAADSNELLPKGWESLWDEGAGKSYYVNYETGESSWDPPEDVTAVESARLATENDVASTVEDKTRESLLTEDDAPLPPGWRKIVDEDVGQTYYFNEETGDSSWDPPPTAIKPEVNVADSAEEILTTDSVEPSNHSQHEESEQAESVEECLPDGWKKKFDTDGTPYYHNESTGESDWNPPAGIASPTVENREDGALDSNESDSTLITSPIQEESAHEESVHEECLPGGWKKKFDTDGTPYYHNETTGESGWKPPTETAILAVEHKKEDITVGNNESVTSAGGEASQIETSAGQSEPAAETQENEKATNSERLPQGWEKLYDTDGTPYYYNESTDESGWQPPHSVTDAATDVDERYPEVEPETTNESPDSSPWQKHFDESTGDYYFYNTETGETSWDAPATMTEAPTEMTISGPQPQDDLAQHANDENVEEEESKSPKLASGWQRVLDETSGDYYYYHEESGDVTWDLPSGDNVVYSTEIHPAEDPAASISHTDTKDKQADGWERVLDEISGDYYYYNKITQETSWDPPVSTVPSTSKSSLGVSGEPLTIDETVAADQTLKTHNEKSDRSESTRGLPVEPAANSVNQGQKTGSQVVSGAASLDHEAKAQVPADTNPPSDSEVPAVSGATGLAPPGRTTEEYEQLTGPQSSPQETCISPNQEASSEWTELIDRDSGRKYFYNPATGETSWDHPSEIQEDISNGWIKTEKEDLNEWVQVLNPQDQYEAFRGRPCAVAFGFGGTIVTVKQATVKVCHLRNYLSNNVVVKDFSLRVGHEIKGPLLNSNQKAVYGYMDYKAEYRQDFLWNLCLLTAQSKGRLRIGKDRHSSKSGAERTIMNLLLNGEDNQLSGPVPPAPVSEPISLVGMSTSIS